MASHPRAISRERDVNVRTDPTPNTHEQGDTRLIMNLGQYEDEDEDLAYNLAAQVEQDRFTKRQHRHWHVYHSHAHSLAPSLMLAAAAEN